MMKKNKKIHLSVPYIDLNEKKRILESVEKNEISTYGRNVSLFEKNISKLTGAKYNLAVKSTNLSIVGLKPISLKKDLLLFDIFFHLTF